MMAKLVSGFLAASTLVMVAGTPPVRAADLCVQVNGAGCALSGDLGYFRFMKWRLPGSNKVAKAVNGRACGFGPLTGTAILDSSGTQLAVNITFDCDATRGSLYLGWDDASNPTVGSTIPYVYASYGDYDYTSACDATVVDCATEP